MTDIGRVFPVNIEDEVSSSYIDYAMSVIIGRALPDVRDGLKPVHRRILYSMYENKISWNRAHKKSARVVGDCMGKYHPHGDSAIYDALARMAQPFNMRLPLIDGQGNFGSIDGDPPAAMRYTEVRMARSANSMMADLEKDTVDFVANYDEQETEPSVLPARIPNLLVNGSEGIAVGMATKIPPHNLIEVVNATIHMIENPDASVLDLMNFIQGPDFPTYGILCGLTGIRDAYMTGRGVVKIRAKCDIERNERTDRESIIVTELPFQVNKARLVGNIAKLVRDKRLDGISNLRDESDRRGMRVVVELKRDAIAEIVLNKLYKMTKLQTSFGVIMLAIVAGRPQLLPLDAVLRHFIDHRRDVVTRRTRFELRKAQEREHILLGLQIALDHLDAVISLIRASDSPEAARTGLMSTFSLSQRQSQAILDMRLQRLTGLERAKIADELKEIQALIERLSDILNDETLLMAVIVAELEEVRNLHGDARRTIIVPDEAELTLEDLIADEEMVVTVTHAGYLKRTALDQYRAQRRGGKGRTGMATKDDDFVEDIFVASTHSAIMIFTDQGRVFLLKVHQVPLGGPTTRGRPIVNLLEMREDEKVATVLPMPSDHEAEYIVMATEGGTIKRTRLDSFQNIYSRGIIAIKLRDGDQLIKVRLCNDTDHLFLPTSGGKSIRFEVSDVSPTGRDTMGVRGIRLDEGDNTIGMVVIHAPDQTLLSVTENGYGKRTSISDYPVQRRGGKGVITIKTSERNGAVVGCRQVTDNDDLVLITNTGRLIRTRSTDVPIIGRNTQGVRIMKTGGDEYIAGIALLAESDDDSAEDAENGDLGTSDGETNATVTDDGAAVVDPGVTVDEVVALAEADAAVRDDESDES